MSKGCKCRSTTWRWPTSGTRHAGSGDHGRMGPPGFSLGLHLLVGYQPRLMLEPTASIPLLPSFGIRFRF
jgi:hypothetical protein